MNKKQEKKFIKNTEHQKEINILNPELEKKRRNSKNRKWKKWIWKKVKKKPKENGLYIKN